MKAKLSILISTFNEMENPYLWQNLTTLYAKQNTIETIIVDGGSQDGTIEKLKNIPQIKTIITNKKERGKRLNIAAQSATSDFYLFLHPRTLLKADAYEYLLKHKDNLRWGAFLHSFDTRHPLLQFTSWYSNYVRPKKSKVFYLDHCIFSKKDLIDKIGGFPETPIFEDTILSKKLAKLAPYQLLPIVGTTSAVRFKKKGLWRQISLNQMLKLAFSLGISLEQLNRIYEKQLNLNSHYE